MFYKTDFFWTFLSELWWSFTVGWNIAESAPTSPCHDCPAPENSSLPLIFTCSSPSSLLTAHCGTGSWLFCMSWSWLLILSAIFSLKPSCSNQGFGYSPFYCVLLLFYDFYLLFWELFFAHKTTLKSYTRVCSGSKVSFHSISFMKSPFAKATTISSFLSIFWEMAFEFINICTYAHTFFSLSNCSILYILLCTWLFPFGIMTWWLLQIST